MDEKHKETEERAVEAAKKKDDGGGGTAPDDKTRLKELERENKELKQQVLALQKQLEELEAEKKAAANRSRAQKLLRKIEKSGLAFESDEDREQELSRLAGLSDDAFAASEAAFERMMKAGPRAHTDDKDAKDRGAGVETTKASCGCDDPPLRSDAGVRPKDIEDKKTSLEDRLKSGFMAAYRQRVASATGEPVSNN